MKAKQIPVTTGPAGGTFVTRVESNSGKLLGFIRVVECDWTAVLGGSTMYIAHQCYSADTLENSKYDVKAFKTLADAYYFLGVTMEDLDNSSMGEYPFSEKIPFNYWKTRKMD